MTDQRDYEGLLLEDRQMQKCYSRLSTTPILGWKSMSVSCQRAKGSLGVSCNIRKAMLMVCSGEKPAAWINLEGERKRWISLHQGKVKLLHPSSSSEENIGVLTKDTASMFAVAAQ